MQGLADFNVATTELLLGAGAAAVKEGRVATVQSLSGTGSLRVVRLIAVCVFLPEVQGLRSTV